ncbi:MAG: CsgG/HfaB family protein [Limisphaerales bacterium]
MIPNMNQNPSTRPIRLAVQFFLLVVFAIMFAGCASLMGPPPPPPKANWQAAPSFSASALTKLAVIAEDKARRSQGSEDALVRSVEDQFITKLLGKGYQISARSDVQQVLEEIRFQQSGLTEAGAAKLGRMLNVSAVLIVTINSANVTSSDTGLVLNGVPQKKHAATCNMSARLISVEKAEILGITSFSSSVAAASRDDASPGILFTAAVIADSVPARNEQPGAAPGSQ